MGNDNKKLNNLGMYDSNQDNIEQIKDKGVLNQSELWKSLNQFQKAPDALEAKKHEFKSGVTKDFNPDGLPAKSRRKFMAVLGASAAFAATACTDYRNKGEIISYNKKPEEITYGKANHYASSLNDGSGILVKTREGRPIKIDGNPDHPIAQGKTSSIGQSCIMNLYDPSRLKDPIDNKNGKAVLTWQDADSKIVSALNSVKSSGKEIAIITGKVISPTQAKLFADFKLKYPTTKVYSYSLHNDSNRIEAWKDSYGTDMVPSLRWDKAKVILAVESDFLGTDDNHIENTRLFVKTRNADDLDNFSRLYSVESVMSLTGSNADYRMRLTPEAQYSFVMALVNEASRRGLNVSGVDTSIANSYKIKDIIEKEGLDKKKVDYLLDDLVKNRNKVLVHTGDASPKELHVAVNLLNEVLGSASEFYDFTNSFHSEIPLSTTAELKNLANDLSAEKVGAVIVFDSNPAYHFHNELVISNILPKAQLVVTLTETENETSVLGTYTLPINHALESWGDFQNRRGIVSLQQPVIAPLYNTRQKEAVLLNWLSANPANFDEEVYHKFMKSNWESNFYATSGSAFGFNEFWFSCIHDGFYTYSAESTEALAFNSEAVARNRFNKQKSGFTIVLGKSYFVGDGRYADNGWLQELPHPLSKVAWDNYAAMAPKTAEKLGVQYFDNKASMIRVRVEGRNIEIAAIPQPGMAEDVIAIELGYGRTQAGEIGTDVGFDANKLMGENGISQWIYTGAEVTVLPKKYMLVSTQEHHSLDDEFVKDFHRIRRIVQEATIEEYKKDKNVIKDQALMSTKDVNKKMVNPPKEYGPIKWGMAIDLNKCTGCNDCVSACNVENNIPIVGKEQVGKGREMHWIRMDRYYSGSPEDPIISHQAMACQHCDNAPCENVCPVVATTHSPEGLNQMTYNRCVGTRYCANNCPYKVRRFNFFDFRHYIQDGIQAKESFSLMQNPEVTVRSRGVMEKCTFCVQRIMETRTEAKERGEEFVGQGVTTACQEACPAEAIEFGNLQDPESKVSKLRDHDLTYRVLEVLGVKPNINYIAKLRNIHTEAEHSEHHH